MDNLVVRHALPIAQEMLTVFPAIIIEGARQVGKSTLATMIAPQARIANLDEDVIRSAAQADPALLVASDRPLIIDEIQRLPELTLAIKTSIDNDRRPGRFILTGSSSLLKVKGLADSLVGRVGRLSLFGLSKGEMSAHRDDFASAAVRLVADDSAILDFHTTTTRQNYADMLEMGSYPEVITLTPRTRRIWFDSYLSGMVYRDLREQRTQYDPERGLAVIRVLAGHPASELVISHLARDARIPASSTAGYVDLFRSAGLVASIPPWTPNLSKRESGRSKTFLLDSGLALRTTRITSSQLLAIENLESFGGFLEAMVDTELLKQQTWTETEHEVFHFRDRDGWEVDALLELTGGGVIGIEVKASTTFKGDQFNGLRRLRDSLGSRFVAGFVLNTGQEGFRYADRLYGLPISALWEL